MLAGSNAACGIVLLWKAKSVQDEKNYLRSLDDCFLKCASTLVNIISHCKALVNNKETLIPTKICCFIFATDCSNSIENDDSSTVELICSKLKNCNYCMLQNKHGNIPVTLSKLHFCGNWVSDCSLYKKLMKLLLFLAERGYIPVLFASSNFSWYLFFGHKLC